MRWVLIGVFLLTSSGCAFTSRMLDLNHHRQAYITQRGDVSPVVQRMILARQIGPGMTIEEAQMSWSGGQVWVPYGQHWIVREGSTRFVIVVQGGKVASVKRYGL